MLESGGALGELTGWYQCGFRFTHDKYTHWVYSQKARDERSLYLKTGIDFPTKYGLKTMNILTGFAIFSFTMFLAAIVATVRRLIGSSWGTALCLLGVLACGLFLGATMHTPGMYRAPVPTTLAAALYFLGIILVYVESRRPVQEAAGAEDDHQSDLHATETDIAPPQASPEEIETDRGAMEWTGTL